MKFKKISKIGTILALSMMVASGCGNTSETENATNESLETEVQGETTETGVENGAETTETEASQTDSTQTDSTQTETTENETPPELPTGTPPELPNGEQPTGEQPPALPNGEQPTGEAPPAMPNGEAPPEQK